RPCQPYSLLFPYTTLFRSAVATDEENVFTIEVNEENKGRLSAVFAAFRLVEVPPVEVTTYQLGVEVRDLDDKRTDEVDVVVTNQDRKSTRLNSSHVSISYA